jgi:hypothetical protein
MTSWKNQLYPAIGNKPGERVLSGSHMRFERRTARNRGALMRL